MKIQKNCWSSGTCYDDYIYITFTTFLNEILTFWIRFDLTKNYLRKNIDIRISVFQITIFFESRKHGLDRFCRLNPQK